MQNTFKVTIFTEKTPLRGPYFPPPSPKDRGHPSIWTLFVWECPPPYTDDICCCGIQMTRTLLLIGTGRSGLQDNKLTLEQMM